MDNINFRILDNFDNGLIETIKKLELENLGEDAAINEWQIPVIIRYGKFMTAENDSGEIIGVCEVLRSWNDAYTAFIHSFYIVKNYRKIGIGRKLLEFAVGFCRAEKFSRIELTVDPENITALNLYKSCGFEIRQLKHNEYGSGIDRYLMALKL